MKDELSSEIRQHRTMDYPIHPLILNRWSPRAMSGESISRNELMSLFEAARWAPSSHNDQPWRFIYALCKTPAFAEFLDLVSAFNRQWASRAAVLGVIASHRIFEYNHKPSPTHAFDTGAAWENLCLEGTHRSLVVHGIGDFDHKQARQLLQIPDDYDILAMFAVGKRARAEILSPDLQKRELPNQRIKVEQFVMEGRFLSTT